MSGPHCWANSTARAPLAPSRANVSAASHLRPVRRTFVAPIFPEPIARMSPSPAARVTTKPNGIEPRRYAPAKAARKYGQTNDQLIGSGMVSEVSAQPRRLRRRAVLPGDYSDVGRGRIGAD